MNFTFCTEKPIIFTINGKEGSFFFALMWIREGLLGLNQYNSRDVANLLKQVADLENQACFFLGSKDYSEDVCQLIHFTRVFAKALKVKRQTLEN